MTGKLTGNILCTAVRAGATVLKEMVVETTYNAISSKLLYWWLNQRTDRYLPQQTISLRQKTVFIPM